MKTYIRSIVISFLLISLAACYVFTANEHLDLDSNIKTSVNAALLNSHQFDGTNLQVEANDGNVQLIGYVKTIRQSDLAADIASKVEGVKFVENNLIVRK